MMAPVPGNMFVISRSEVGRSVPLLPNRQVGTFGFVYILGKLIDVGAGRRDRASRGRKPGPRCHTQ